MVELGIIIKLALGFQLRFRASAEMELHGLRISDAAWDDGDKPIAVRVCNRSENPFEWKIGSEVAVMTIQKKNGSLLMIRCMSDASNDSLTMGHLDVERTIPTAQRSEEGSDSDLPQRTKEPFELYGGGCTQSSPFWRLLFQPGMRLQSRIT